MKIIIWCLLLSIVMSGRVKAQTEWLQFGGMCDASAMEMLNDDLFVVGNDEDNVLRVYSRSRPGFPVQTVDFSSSFAIKKKKSPEMDLEAAARIGNRIYWISSHGANAKGKFQLTRHRFFATEVYTNNGISKLRVVGRLYSDLVRDLASQPEFQALNLIAATRKAPKSTGALNIEGLSPTADGQLLIGFRNPIPAGKALIVRLQNPDAVTAGQTPKFGLPQYVDLGGFGIRSITPYREGFLIVAGPFDSDGGASRLHFWDGVHEKTEIISLQLPANPEGIALIRRQSTDLLFAISDDGTVEVDGSACKKLKDNSLKSFRAYQFPLPAANYRAAVQRYLIQDSECMRHDCASSEIERSLVLRGGR